MSTTGQRVREEREKRGLSQADLADLAGVSVGWVAKVEQDAHKRHIGEEIIKLADALEMNVADIAVSLPDYKLRLYVGKQALGAARRDFKTAVDRVPPSDLKAAAIPEFDVRAGAGGGGVAMADYVSDGFSYMEVDALLETWHLPSSFVRQELKASETESFILEILGDSMFPTLSSGDRVVVDKRATYPSPDGIYAIHDGYGIMVKRLQIIRGARGEALQVEVISDNENHKTWVMDLGEGLPGRVIGRVVGRISRM